MHVNAADFTQTFRRLCAAAEDEAADRDVSALFAAPAAYDDWARGWRARLRRETFAPRVRAEQMRRVNSAVIPRNHRIEQTIEAAVDRADVAPFSELLAVLSRPLDDRRNSRFTQSRRARKSSCSRRFVGRDDATAARKARRR